MAELETAAALRNAIYNYAQACVDHAIAARAGWDEIQGTEQRMLHSRAAVEAAIDVTALTLAADMVEGLRQIINMVDAPHFGDDRKCRIRSMASDLVGRAEALHIGRESADEAY